MRTRSASAVVLATAVSASAQSGGAFDLTWWAVGGGGGSAAGGTLTLSVTIGQADAGSCSGGAISVAGGFWPVAPPSACYANCDDSTTVPVLNVLDFLCFLNRFAAGDAYANCDNSTTVPVLNVLDFLCFLNRFAAGCS
jgi:hypothetical protein